MRRGPDPSDVGISLAIHVVLLVPLVIFARPPAPIQFETYRVNLVAAPAEVLPEPAAAEPEPQPTPAPPEREPEPEPEAEAREEPPPEPEREPEPDIEKPPETPEERPRPTEPTETEAEGGAPVNIATEGLEFPFPDYLANVQTQLLRYFRWNEDSNPKGTIYFEILPNGRVRNIRMVDPSGNFRFDLAAQGAVETISNRGAFGPLPKAFAGPFLPVLLEIEPPR